MGGKVYSVYPVTFYPLKFYPLPFCPLPFYDSPLKPQIPKTQMTECICRYRNGTTKIANDGVIRSAERGTIS